ncbi:MAG: indolepyruvate oxidoreductase subunit beta [Candidatus Nealsonbacteria bacterium]|nr:indolepyruvate oxidoreductase subunit beta [Candidatus Nealsonbacteria bacterium]
MKNKINQFNIVICGVGGQGLITMTKILAIAAQEEGYEAKTSELHGLAQRGGSVETHVRFGKKIYSPLVKAGGADLIIALEAQEAVKASFYASKKTGTVFLINKFLTPIIEQELIPLEKISKTLEDFSKKTLIVPATEVTQKEFNNSVLAGTYLLGKAIYQDLIPLKIPSILKAMQEIVPDKFLEINKKAFELAGNLEKQK